MRKNIFFCTVIIVLLFATGYVVENKIPDLHYGAREVTKIEKKIAEKEYKLNQYFDLFIKESEVTGNVQSVKLEKDLFKEEGLTILAYVHGKLKFWSDNSADVNNDYAKNGFQKPLINLGNYWFYVKTQQQDSIKLVGLILIKKNYPYENRYLEKKFEKSFNVPVKAKLSEYPQKRYFKVFNSSNDYIFSISFRGVVKYKFARNLITALIYSLGVFFILYLLVLIIISQKSRIRRNVFLFSGLAVLFFLRWLMLFYNFPKVFYSFNLFNPVYFAGPSYFPSLGDLLIFSVIFTYASFLIWYFFSFNRKYLGKNTKALYIISGAYVVVLTVIFLFIQYIFNNLIYNSSLNLEPYRILELSIYSFVAYLILALNYLSLSLLIIKYFVTFSQYLGAKGIVINGVVLVPIFSLWVYFFPKYLSVTSGLFLVFLSIAIGLFCYNKKKAPTFSESIILVLFVSLFTVFYIDVNTKIKEQRAKKVLAANLSSEHDAVAEMLLENLNLNLSTDTIIYNFLLKQNITDSSVEALVDYVRKNYFSGYWNKYDLLVTVCRPEESIFVESANSQWLPCYEFFKNLLDEAGSRLGRSDFYFLDNTNGRVSYFGEILYVDTVYSQETKLFIELDSRRVSDQLGYPELLLNEKVSRKTGYKYYSYAKYFKGKLITHYGDFPYSLGSSAHGLYSNEYTYTTFGGYDHLIYNVDKENQIIISKRSVTLFNLLISFSYITSFFYILIGLIYLLINLRQSRARFASNFKNKIQFATISILLLTFLLIGGGTIFFSISQYKEKHYEILSEKIQSVYIELVHKLENEKVLTQQWHSSSYDNLNQLLIKFSDVFYTDINLYSPRGDLLATSRPEIYENKLLAERMDMNAFQALTSEQRAEFVHDERMGNLEFLSAYVPFINIENEILAYLNLPYFTRQEVLTAEVSNLIVAVINIYVLLILLAVAVTVFISDQLTKPLRLIQDKFGSISLGAKQEHIEYTGKDEIGNLVNEYNRMVDELSRSVELLAKSERESAWREMAKQVAHEIKNPLTPMKLSVQHLMRSWKEKQENNTLEEYLNKFSKTLIEQIDNLSYIATAFSNFAKMPVAEFKKVKIFDVLKSTSELFKQQDNIKIELSNTANDDLWVYIDKEQLSRAVLNLVKNSIQSIPSNIKGVIKINIDKEDGKAFIKIEDNGTGIPDEIQEKMFIPNFTTKSSGMGLGLAITKKIIENAQGTIRYQTKTGQGTTFIIELPIVK